MKKDNFKILVVDDNKSVCQVVVKVLQRAGFHNVTPLTDAVAALGTLEKESYDLVVTDYQMPVVCGDDITLAALVSNPEVVVLVLSGSLDQETRENLYRLGVWECIKKPFDINGLMNVIEGIFLLQTDLRERKARIENVPAWGEAVIT